MCNFLTFSTVLDFGGSSFFSTHATCLRGMTRLTRPVTWLWKHAKFWLM